MSEATNAYADDYQTTDWRSPTESARIGESASWSTANPWNYVVISPSRVQTGGSYREWPKGTRRQYSHEKEIYRTRSDDFKIMLNQAFIAILDTLDNELTDVERSNSFDDWKYELKDISQASKSLDVRQRKLLGALIASSLRKDLTDFEQRQLELFRDATNLIRSPSLKKVDSKRMLSEMRKAGLKMRLSLSVDGLSDNALAKLDAYMDDLLSHEQS